MSCMRQVIGVGDVVKDPHNGQLAIMNLIFVSGAMADVTKVAKAARICRAMKPEDIIQLRPRFLVAGGPSKR